jgi:mRNA-degrading endonuclease RelE of RelBE toxin-antitoxin system
LFVVWNVSIKRSIRKDVDKLPPDVFQALRSLVREIETYGPLRYNWKNFGKLRGARDHYHCHIKSGRPTFVVCWEVTDKEVKIVEVYYAGTHEKSPY